MRAFLTILIAGLVLSAASAQELVTLTTPVTIPSTAAYHVSQLILDVDTLSITVTLKGANVTDAPIVKVYNSATNPSGATLLHNLNTGNFSVNSLIKQVYTRLIADGVIAGSVSGTPQE